MNVCTSWKPRRRTSRPRRRTRIHVHGRESDPSRSERVRHGNGCAARNGESCAIHSSAAQPGGRFATSAWICPSVPPWGFQ